MDIRTGTKEKYIAFLHRIGGLTTTFNPNEEAAKDKLDLKLISFLKNKGYLQGDKNEYEANYTPERVTSIFEEFIRFRDDVQAKYEETQYLLKHKELAKTLLDEHFNPSKKVADVVVSDSTIEEIVKYTKLAIELGKTDVVGFVKLLYNTK